VTAREDPALSADPSQRPPLRSAEQPEGKGEPPGLPPPGSPEQPDGKGEPPGLPPPGSPEQPDGKGELPGLPPLHFPRQPDGQGLAPAPGAAPPPAPWNAPPSPPPGPGPSVPPGAPPDAGRWGNGRPPGRPAGPGRPLRPPESAVRQRAVAAVLLGVLSLLALLGVGSNFHRGIYLVIFSFLVGLSAVWFGVTATRRARASVTMRPRGAVAGTVLGIIGAVLGAVLLIAFAAFWPQLNTFSRCLDAANTPSAQQACLDQLHRSVPG
jgi:uncharacterized membrane protein YeaQ/YmgE (transglycosylase-associated protein family)